SDGQTLGKPVLLGPPEAVLGTVEEFFCELDKVPGGLAVLYKLFKDDYLIGDYSAHTGEPGKFLILVKHTHDGRFICEASGQNNTEVTPSFSDPKRFKVIEKAEAARITSEPDSEVFWEGESVTLQCSVISGTYLSYEWQLNDSLVVHRYNRSQGQLTIQRLSTSDSGVYSCSASNHFNGSLYSTSTTALVVRVKEQLSEPEISFQVIGDGKGIFSALVTCMSERGTPPVTIHLLKNNRSLAVEHGLRVVFSVPIHLNQDMGLVQCQATDGTRIMHSKPQNITVDPQSTGIYHCEAANAFNNVTRVQSPKRLISKEGNCVGPVSV
ncbi:muscle, skeletal receptor tyrosine protein kinase-like isoform X2, partial [Astyanax mexicanus]